MSTTGIAGPGPLVTLGARVAVPARMRTAILRRSLREHPGPAVAGLCGLLAAVWLIRYAVRGDQHTLSILAGTWVLGWIVLPLLLGGGRGRIRPSHLRLEPIGGFAAAAGLLAASAVGIGPAVSLVALTALPVHAARYGPRAFVITAFGALLLWLIGLIGSAVALEAVGHAGGPAGAILTGVFTGTVMGVLGSIWAVAPWLTLLLVAGPPGEVVHTMRFVPSGWPISAVLGPPDRRFWMLSGLVALVLLCAVAYVALVRRSLSGTAGFRPKPPRGTLTPAKAGGDAAARPVLSGVAAPPAPAADSPPAGNGVTPYSVLLPRETATTRRSDRAAWLPAPVRAVAGRELHTWARHPLRLQYLAFAVVYGVLLAGLPLLADVDLLAPWAGALTVLWAAAMSAGLVGLDGTALWLPFTTPGGERAEVRGRAVAWLALAVPIALLLTLAGVLTAPGVDPLPALTVLPAFLGAGATFPVWVSLLRVRPVPDPRHPTAADNPTDIISVLVAAGAGLVAAAPGFALLVWGPDGLRWLAPLAGLACGAAAWWGGVWLADDRLARHRTEVLTAAGQRTRPPEPPIPLTWDADWYRENRATAWALILLTVGWIPVIPQGLMVLAFGIDGGWIIASHLEGAARTGVALAMVALGGAMLLTGLVLWGRRPGRAEA
ncbi:hypothetical protein [Actinoplanes aureus]|uniref:ABC-2 type transport system permease protein n=1 Tax=Actinoplanes aureus TaxID=2792083 RepID=A0A931C6S2_9ACTN|nr:hypothetical protein [Actinoplanes aureus]MBG0561161.1 hypothetical protein [Actinoplanes aureus]